jgi:hypothetical protein
MDGTPPQLQHTTKNLELSFFISVVRATMAATTMAVATREPRHSDSFGFDNKIACLILPQFPTRLAVSFYHSAQAQIMMFPSSRDDSSNEGTTALRFLWL